MDSKIIVFLELTVSLLKFGGREYKDPVFKLQMLKNGLCSIQYAPLLEQYKEVEDFFNLKRRGTHYRGFF